MLRASVIPPCRQFRSKGASGGHDYFQSCFDASRAPSAIAFSLAQAISGSTWWTDRAKDPLRCTAAVPLPAISRLGALFPRLPSGRVDGSDVQAAEDLHRCRQDVAAIMTAPFENWWGRDVPHERRPHWGVVRCATDRQW